MPDSDYQSVERVLLLLIYLMGTKDGATREDVYRDVPGYPPSESAQRRMFERDMHQLQNVGFRVIRKRCGLNASNLNKRGAKHSIYRLSMPSIEVTGEI